MRTNSGHWEFRNARRPTVISSDDDIVADAVVGGPHDVALIDPSDAQHIANMDPETTTAICGELKQARTILISLVSCFDDEQHASSYGVR